MIDIGILLASTRTGGQNLFPANKCGVFIPAPLNEAAHIIEGLLVNEKGCTC